MSSHGYLDTLATAVRVAVASRPGWLETARLVASELERHLPSPSVLTAEQRAGDAATFRSHVLHSEPDGSFSIVALVWRPGQMTRIHDHVTWEAFAVIQGAEHEELFTLDEDGACLVEAGSTVDATGDVSAFAPLGDIHRVRNAGNRTAISIHIYGLMSPGSSAGTTTTSPCCLAERPLEQTAEGGLGRPPRLLRSARAQPRVTASA